jgi:putative transposase
MAGCLPLCLQPVPGLPQNPLAKLSPQLEKGDIQKELAALAKEIPWLACLQSQTLQEATDRLWHAYHGFFKSGKGYPRFARRGHFHSFTFKQGVRLHPNSCMVQLPKLGKIKYHNSRPLPADATIKRTSVSHQADGWYVVLCLATDITYLPPATHANVGMDVGIQALATLSTGEAIANPLHLQQGQHRFARLQRAASCKRKGSHNRPKAVQKLARQHFRVRKCRQDYLHKLTTRLIRENQAIITERLNIAGVLKNHSLARSIAYASWGELKRLLAYKAL